MARDPVCYMDVDESTALKENRFCQYGGETYYFCCEDCQQRFDADPRLYLAPGRELQHLWLAPATS